MGLWDGRDYKMVKKVCIKKIIDTKTEQARAFPEQTYEFAEVLDQQIAKIRAFIEKTTQGQGAAFPEVAHGEMVRGCTCFGGQDAILQGNFLWVGPSWGRPGGGGSKFDLLLCTCLGGRVNDWFLRSD